MILRIFSYFIIFLMLILSGCRADVESEIYVSDILQAKNGKILNSGLVIKVYGPGLAKECQKVWQKISEQIDHYFISPLQH